MSSVKPSEGESQSRKSSLDITDEAMFDLSDQFVALALNYFAGVSQMTVFPQKTGAEIKARFDGPAPLTGEPLAKLLDDCREMIAGARHNGHPRFFGYVASPSTAPGAFADLLASTVNSSVTSWRSAPSATQIERTVVRWLGSLIGYDDNAHGTLTSGGSMANLTALLIALRVKSDRQISQEGFWNAGAPMTAYASDQIHLSVTKAADILGLGKRHVRLLPGDDEFRLDVRALRAAIESDKQNGFKPFCVIASAGTAGSGAIDPLREVATVAREHDLWFHIDGAYGAPAAMVAEQREQFAGLELADSISLDPHKWLYTPVDCGCLLLHDASAARRAFVTEADYIKVHEQGDTESFAFWDYGIELSRRFRALKIWLTLKYYGAERIAESVADDIAMARYLAQLVDAAEDFELLAPVALSICCFRYLPARLRKQLEAAQNNEERERVNAQLNHLNERIMQVVQRGGRAYLSNAVLRGKFALRACIINFRTTRADIDITFEVVQEAARQIEAASEDR
jgi:glutamate/tyrosine decarboxylase-like PLP-dependent enzyme